MGVFVLFFFFQVVSGQSTLLYGYSIDQLNYNDFASRFQMPNTFNTWFLITEIHVWMLMVRAMSERQHAEIIRNTLVESLWADVMIRTKELAPDDSRTVKKQIIELSGQFQYAIISYDEGLTKDDKQMASALWKRFFNSNCDNYEHIELMVKYIRYNVSVLRNGIALAFILTNQSIIPIANRSQHQNKQKRTNWI